MKAPGTSPIVDIVDYRLNVFGDEVDGMVRRLANGLPQFPSHIEALMWQCWPNWVSQPKELSTLRTALADELERLKMRTP